MPNRDFLKAPPFSLTLQYTIYIFWGGGMKVGLVLVLLSEHIKRSDSGISRMWDFKKNGGKILLLRPIPDQMFNGADTASPNVPTIVLLSQRQFCCSAFH